VLIDLDLTTVLDEGERVESVQHLRLEPDVRVVGEARSFVIEHAPELPEDDREVLRLLTSELVTNAVIHARTTIELAVVTSDRHVVVTVHDLDIGHVEVRAHVGREGGWGLGLVRSLADRSDMTRHPGGGKTAWFRLPR
jgi:anti-sigma regulatory factor (Ser/Thr protein kinase)